uniref:Bulb-type lectin domain-containing protein n=1 Tax=Manihot esculenta TaxID=3983 RepID=A0A2C9UES6_MANES
MCVASTREPYFEIPIKHFQGKPHRFPFSSVLAVVVSLCFVSCGFCDELALVSVPLGFEISGFDRTRTWVSQNGVFAFGFLECCQKDDDGFLVGVRYNLGDKTVNMPVWAIGGGLRVSMNSTIRLSMDGGLILFENPSGLIVWSSSTSNLGVKKATLLDNGNLVLVGNGDRVLWESFHSPTSTLLPGQTLHFPQTLRAPSMNSISSYYTFVIQRSGELALVWENNVTYWRTHLSFSSNIMEARFDADGFLGLKDATNRTIWSTSSNDFKDPSVTLRHLRMDYDGNLRIYSWDHVLHEWKITWQAVGNQCDVFGSCGLYGFCRFKSTGPVCDCLYQDSSNWGASSVTMDSGGLKCKKMVDLSNCKMNTSMVDMKQSVLYGLYPPQDVAMMLNEKDCKGYCSNDPTCIAATSKNDGSDQLGPTIYKGVLPNKRPFIAKKVNDASVNEKDFRMTVSMLGGMHHRNLVSLNGFCFEQVQNDGNWQQRFDIALGVARALAYLHSECQKLTPKGGSFLLRVDIRDRYLHVWGDAVANCDM